MSLSKVKDDYRKPTYSTDELNKITTGLKVASLKKYFSFEEGQSPTHNDLKGSMQEGKFAVNLEAMKSLIGDGEAIPPVQNVFETEVNNPPQNLFSEKFNGNTQQIVDVLVILKNWFEEAEAREKAWKKVENPFVSLSPDEKGEKAKSLIPKDGLLANKKITRVLTNYLVFNDELSIERVGDLKPSVMMTFLSKKIKDDVLQNIGNTHEFEAALATWINKCKNGTFVANVILKKLSTPFKNSLTAFNAPEELKNYLKENELLTAAKCHHRMNNDMNVCAKINTLICSDGGNNFDRMANFMAILSSAVHPQPVSSSATMQDAPVDIEQPVPGETKTNSAAKTSLEQWFSIRGKTKYKPPSAHEFNAFHKELKALFQGSLPTSMTAAILNMEFMDMFEGVLYLSLEIRSEILSLPQFNKLSKNYAVVKSMGSDKFTTETESNTKAWFKKHQLSSPSMDSSVKACIAELGNIATTMETKTDQLFLNVFGAIHTVSSDTYDICVKAHLKDEVGKRAIIDMALTELSNAVENALVDKDKTGKLDVNDIACAIMSDDFKIALRDEAGAKVQAKTVKLHQQLQNQLDEASSYEKRKNNNKRQAADEHQDAPRNTQQDRKNNSNNVRRNNFKKIMVAAKNTTGKANIPIKNMPDSIKNLFDPNQCMVCVCGGVHGIECLNNHNNYKKMMPTDVKKIIADPQAFKALF